MWLVQLKLLVEGHVIGWLKAAEGGGQETPADGLETG